MIVSFETPQDRRNARIKLYKDDVFLIAHEAVNKMELSLDMVDLFASAVRFAGFLLENNLSDRALLRYELDELRAEVPDGLTYYNLIAITFVKLSALRKKEPNAEAVARALVRFCQEYSGFADLLKQLQKKEIERWLDNKRTNLLKEELHDVKNDSHGGDGKAAVAEIVDVAAEKLSSDAMLAVESVLAIVNDKSDHLYQEELERLREASKKKSVTNFNFDKLNDIHDNQNVTIGK